MIDDMRTFIISDLHLGARNSRTDLLMKLLNERFDLLILNGDIVDHLNFHAFRDRDWNVVYKLQLLAYADKVVCLRGNHDYLNASCSTYRLVSSLITGVKHVYDDTCYNVTVGKDRYIITHGHVFDDTLFDSTIRDIADWIYDKSQYISSSLAHFLKMSVKHYGGVLSNVKQSAVEFAKCNSYDGIICGHTHYPADETIDGIRYMNTGCWVGKECSYICIEHNEAKLCYY